MPWQPGEATRPFCPTGPWGRGCAGAAGPARSHPVSQAGTRARPAPPLSCCLCRGAPSRERWGRWWRRGLGSCQESRSAAEAEGGEPQRFCWEVRHQKVLELHRSQAASNVAYPSLAPRASPTPPSLSSLKETWEHISISLHSFREVFVGFRSLPGI